MNEKNKKEIKRDLIFNAYLCDIEECSIATLNYIKGSYKDCDIAELIANIESIPECIEELENIFYQTIEDYENKIKELDHE